MKREKQKNGKQKRGPNKWLLRVFRGYDSDNRRIYYSEIFHGKAGEADERIAVLKNRKKAGLQLSIKTKSFKDYFDEWIRDIDDGNRRECTIKTYKEYAYFYLIPKLGKIAITDITHNMIAELYREMRENYSPYTIRLVHSILSQSLKSAYADDLLVSNPMEKISALKKTPPRPRPKPRAMDKEEMARFLDHANRTAFGFMFELAFFLGARPCEYLGLKWTDLDKSGRSVTIQRSLKRRSANDWYTTDPKTEKGVRKISLTDEIVQKLNARRREQLQDRLKAGPDWGDHGFIFTDEFGEPLKIMVVRNSYRAICKAADLPPDFMLKNTRHSCATALLKDPNIPLKAISDRMGHASVAITLDIYGVSEEEQQREISERMGAYLK